LPAQNWKKHHADSSSDALPLKCLCSKVGTDTCKSAFKHAVDGGVEPIEQSTVAGAIVLVLCFCFFNEFAFCSAVMKKCRPQRSRKPAITVDEVEAAPKQLVVQPVIAAPKQPAVTAAPKQPVVDDPVAHPKSKPRSDDVDMDEAQRPSDEKQDPPVLPAPPTVDSDPDKMLRDLATQNTGIPDVLPLKGDFVLPHTNHVIC
jgi:hypothetical protein